MDELTALRHVKLIVLVVGLIVVLRVDTARLFMLAVIGVVAVGMMIKLNMIRVKISDIPERLDNLSAKM